VYLCGLFKSVQDEDIVKARVNSPSALWQLSLGYDPKPERANHGQGESVLNDRGGPNPLDVQF